MMTDKSPMTLVGKSKLEQELKQLLQEERPAVIKAIEEARSNGDLSENADYDAAKERQGFIEARISEIQGKLATAEVVNPTELEGERVIFASTVTLLDCETDDEVVYQIVGEDEADIKQQKLSVFSPLARSIIGKKVGDVIDFKSPKGEKEYEVTNIEFK